MNCFRIIFLNGFFRLFEDAFDRLIYVSFADVQGFSTDRILSRSTALVAYHSFCFLGARFIGASSAGCLEAKSIHSSRSFSLNGFMR